MSRALKEDLEQQASQIEKITQSIAAADRGECFDHEQVMREMENLIQQAQRSPERRELK